jgi:high-affinity iron transporter
MRTILNCCLAAGTLSALPASAQETPGQRLASVAAVAVSEYRLGVAASGQVVSQIELDEARAFLVDARDVARRLTGDRASAVVALVDSLAVAVETTTLPAEVSALYDRLVVALGPDGALQLPSRRFDRAAGERLYALHCASCHGSRGYGDGAAGATLDPPPAPLAGAEARDVAPGFLFHVISAGVVGTGMKGWAGEFTPDERWDLVAHVAMLRTGDTTLVLGARPPSDASLVEDSVTRLLEAALAAARAGRSTEASDRGFDAYAMFEPIENAVRPRDPGLISRLESQFLAFRAAVRAGDTTRAEATLVQIRAQLPSAVAIASAASGAWSTFVQSFLIALREGFEAILIIGAIIAMLVRTGNGSRRKEVWFGAGIALAASVVLAIVLQTTLRLLPATREVIEGATMLLAVVVLFFVSYWIISKAEATRWQAYIREQVHAAMHGSGRFALGSVAFLVVFREGAESALFYQALLQGGPGTISPVIGGIVVSAAVLSVVYLLVHRFGVRIPARPFFATTGTLLYLMAFIFTGKGLRELQEGGAIAITPLHGWPEIPWLGVFPTVETLGAQWVLVGLFLLALGHTFITPWWRARRRSPGDPALASIEPASTRRPPPRT